MGINPKILDKLITKCKDDPEVRGIIQEFLVMKNDRVPNLKDEYIKIIENMVKESGVNEN